MIPLEPEKWGLLDDAYHAAYKIPTLLRQVMDNPEPDSPATGDAWISLWSSLCHQGDVYTASYAAVPHLVSFALAAEQPISLNFIELPRAIETARMNGKGPEVPEQLKKDYFTTVINSISKNKSKRNLILELCSETDTGSWEFWSSSIKTQAECDEIISTIKQLVQEQKIYAVEYAAVNDHEYTPAVFDENRLSQEVQRSMNNDVEPEKFYWFLSTQSGSAEYESCAKEYWTQERQQKEIEKWRALDA